jgi:hypothetical protein
MNTDVISDEESDDFTDEEEQQTPTLTRQSSICETQLYDTSEQQAESSHTQWYTDIPKNDYSDAHLSNGKSFSFHFFFRPKRSVISTIEHNENNSSIMQSQLSIPSSSSTSAVIADGLLLTYDKNHDWIWRYYVLDDYDLICFPADKKSRASTEGLSDSSCSPLWVSDITNAKVNIKVHSTMQKISSFRFSSSRFTVQSSIKWNVYVCTLVSPKQSMFDQLIPMTYQCG